MSAATALLAIKRKIQGLLNADATVAADNDGARKAFTWHERLPTSAAATTATVGETHLACMPYAAKLVKAYFTVDGTTVGPAAGGVYSTVHLISVATNGSTTTSVAAWTNQTYAFTDQLPTEGTLTTTLASLELAEGQSFQYRIDKTSTTTNNAIPAGTIDLELERMD